MSITPGFVLTRLLTLFLMVHLLVTLAAAPALGQTKAWPLKAPGNEWTLHQAADGLVFAEAANPNRKATFVLPAGLTLLHAVWLPKEAQAGKAQYVLALTFNNGMGSEVRLMHNADVKLLPLGQAEVSWQSSLFQNSKVPQHVKDKTDQVYARHSGNVTKQGIQHDAAKGRVRGIGWLNEQQVVLQWQTDLYVDTYEPIDAQYAFERVYVYDIEKQRLFDPCADEERLPVTAHDIRCARVHYLAAQYQLDKTYNCIGALAMATPDDEFLADMLASIEATQQRWEAYQSSFCQTEAYLLTMGGGTMGISIDYNCRTEMTNTQANHLKTFLAELKLIQAYDMAEEEEEEP